MESRISFRRLRVPSCPGLRNEKAGRRNAKRETKREGHDDDRFAVDFRPEKWIFYASGVMRMRCSTLPKVPLSSAGPHPRPLRRSSWGCHRSRGATRRDGATLPRDAHPCDSPACQHHRLIYREGFSRTKRMPALVLLCPLISRKRAPWLLNRSCRHVAQNQEPAPSAACSAAGRVWGKVPIFPWISDLNLRHIDGLNLFISNEANRCSDKGKINKERIVFLLCHLLRCHLCHHLQFRFLFWTS